MKKAAVKILAVLMVLVLTVCSASAIDLIVDGHQLELDVEPTVIEQRTLVPLRAIFEELGASVEWDQATMTATATKGDQVVQITIGSSTAYVNGVPQTLDVAAIAIDGRTLVPVRFVSEALNAQVDWIQETQTVQITTQATTAAPVPTPTPAPVPTPAPTPTSTDYVKKSGTYVGSLQSDKYHNPNCRYAKVILPENEIWFDTIEEAQAYGYSACGVCNPR